ncbi:MAG TPA: apolipoprotein N-acyltransferase [Devosia sp.]|jgi:apolipoprotein N-acyltransferase|uniref:apolipoprotein N-acyltransferase n=1 Tax=Devosia sp. TaxID=1871048 RepID=UPI002DDD8E6C|nr:apolipoprotein N-acyltransferase [Devosia sp.]HEV2514313.1 apolipoprotein N-acyltransferase [Devosia sp.]
MTWLAETVMLSHGWRRFLIVVVAGAIAAASAPPFFLLPALFITLPVWVWALDGAEHRRGWRRLVGPAFQIGFGFGLGYFAVALHWLGAAFLQEGGVFLVLMPFAIVGLAAILSLFWGLGSALAHLVWSGGAFRIVTLASFLALAEWGRGHLFSGFPFDLLGYALTANDQMLQLASVVGSYGLTFIAALIAMTPALIWPADQRGLVRRLIPIFLAIAVIAAQVAYGNWRLSTTTLTARTDMKVRMVQPMILEHADWSVADPDAIINQLISLSESQLTPTDPGLTGVTHLVWPESVFPFFLTNYPDGIARIARMLPDTTLLLTGAPREPLGDDGLPIPDNPGFNSILAIDSNGEVVASYGKSHLVPFGEYLPFQSFWRLFGINQLVPGTNGWAAGDGRRLMSPPGTPPFLALVCYEAVFPGDIGDRQDVETAQFILNVTNDAWFMGSIGPAQHAHHARMRAVETGLPMLRAANTGMTLSVDPLGRVAAQLAEDQVGVLDVVPSEPVPGGTLFNRVGDLPFWGAVVLGMLGSLVAARRPRRIA